MKNRIEIYPNYSEINSDELYSHQLDIEYLQCIDEGIDISGFEELFSVIMKLPDGINKEKLADILYDYILNADKVADYDYDEPSDLESILAKSNNCSIREYQIDAEKLPDKIAGAWYGRICGCLLGKSVEGIRTDELYPFLKESGNFPLRRYILSSDANDDICNKYKFGFRYSCYADKVSGMPIDDDTNYTVFYQYIIEKYGKNFSSKNIADEWLKNQTKDTYFTAERVAYFNFIKGYYPPESAVYKNPYREWIGAQIRGDYFGYINPGKPIAAAKMAFRDASISHTKNGIYGEMFVAAMIAAAAVEDDIKNIVNAGLNVIPVSSRYYRKIKQVIRDYKCGITYDECIKNIHNEFDEHLSHHWCHVISNAMIVVMALLYGNCDYSKTICMAVEAGFDTDCNGATVGSVIGMMKGRSTVGEKWTYPLDDKINTYMYNMPSVSIEDCINITLRHIGL